ncbi:MAG: MinD/ParA family protein [Deltaproteobacteria bacterium]|nr:MAG: MinD/ParA family protein [Deltaproteobacteria bacterium]
MSCIYPIGGGKGGIGKSFIAANLGVLLARQGYPVVLVDLDLGGANLHTFTGMTHVKVGMEAFLNKSVKNLKDVVVPTNINNLSMISSVNCSMEIANLSAAQKNKIINALMKLPYEYVLLDLGAGTNYNTLDFFLSSYEGIITLTPEPTAVENAFKFIKSLYFRKVKQVLGQNDFKLYSQQVEMSSNALEVTSQVIDSVLEKDPEKGELLLQELKKFKFKFIINQFRKTTGTKLGEKIEKVCNKHFYSEFQFLGNVCYDERVHDSIFSKNIFVNKYSFTVSAIDLSHIVAKIQGNREVSSLHSLERYERL